MARTRSRIEKLRAPFVVTVALGATACGGVSTAHDPNAKPLTGADGGPSSTSCPTVAPVKGDPCEVPSGMTCSREATCSDPAGYDATCVSGVWQVQPAYIACNPPPPPSSICPVAQPGTGDYCNYVGPECQYGSSVCAGIPLYGATCQASQWVVVPWAGGCNPPAPWPFDSGLPWVSIEGGVAVDGGAAPPNP